MTQFRYPLPWRPSRLDTRVYIVSANGNVVFEVEPGQVHGKVVPIAVKLAIAEFTCRSAEVYVEDAGGEIVDLHG